MDLAIELDHEGRLWVSPADGTAREEAWLQGAADTPRSLRASGLCPLGACPRINVYSSLIPRQLYGVGVEMDTSVVSTSTAVRTSRFTGGMTSCKGVWVVHMAPYIWGYTVHGAHA
jgi:hypothetical protein